MMPRNSDVGEASSWRDAIARLTRLCLPLSLSNSRWTYSLAPKALIMREPEMASSKRLVICPMRVCVTVASRLRLWVMRLITNADIGIAISETMVSLGDI